LLLTRVLTAAVLLAGFAAALVFLDRAAFAVLVAAVVALGASEWGRLAGLGRLPALVYALVCLLLFGLLQGGAWTFYVLCAAALFWIAAVPWWLSAGVTAQPRGLLLAAGLVVLVPAGLAMAALPPRYLLMALGLVWVADSAAYFAGRAFGKRKLAPTISPGKTWEGVAGGAFGCVIYAIIWATFDPQLRARVEGEIWMPFLAGTLLLCALSVLGDLLESALKRQAGAKDSGRLLPGHGGVLDRIDSATATLPVAVLLMQAIGATGGT
jgi:phosphatidate cytidylyltransferase